MRGDAVLKLQDVTFRYFANARRPVLDHVSLEIYGGLTVLMGSSGCGKSTLAAVAAGLYPENGGVLESGGIWLYGQPVSQLPPQQRAPYLTMMFQNPDLQFCMDTLRKELLFCLENIQAPPETMEERLTEAAQRLGLTHLLDRKLHTLSGGEKQKAALCCLLLLDSKCIVLDEPFANIDAASARELAEMVRQLKAAGKTIIVIDHKADWWLDAADELIIIGNGGAVKARGITRENVARQRDVFQAEGLCVPGAAAAAARPAKEPGEEILKISGLEAAGETFKNPLFGKRRQPESWIHYGDCALEKGRLTALLGPSGSGKTTLFQTLLGQRLYKGSIQWKGKELSACHERQLFAGIGMVFQNPGNQFVTQNVLEEVAASLKVWKPRLTEAERIAEAERLLDLYGLKRYRKYSPYMLSQGQQRRLAVLSMLAGGQEILLLDEPTYGQDARSTQAIMEQLNQRAREGLAVWFSTHDEDLARKWAHRIWRLKNGGLTEEDWK